MNTFVSFDGSRIAYHDEGEGRAVILLHGYGVDGLGQFGHLDRILPCWKKGENSSWKHSGEICRCLILLSKGGPA